MSKAMRLLVSCKKLTKTGRGGRLTPYFYKVCLGCCEMLASWHARSHVGHELAHAGL